MATKQQYLDVIARKRDEMYELELFAQVSERALRQASNAVKMVDWQRETAAALGEAPPYRSDEAYERAKEAAARVAAFADGENATGQPYLFSTCAVRLCALLEALVDDLVARAIREPLMSKDEQQLARLKGPLIEFAAASPEEQGEYLTETLKQTIDVHLKTGSGRFEALLAPVGLGGQVPDPIRRALCELVQVRNVLMHKGGKADRRLIECCPWLGLERGAKVNVTNQRFHGYRMAAYWYLVEISRRVREQFGEVRNPAAADLLTRAQEEVTTRLGFGREQTA